MKHITYIDRYFVAGKETKEIRRSKVYGEFQAGYPSGWVTLIKVWNTRVNKMVYIRKDCELVEVID